MEVFRVAPIRFLHELTGIGARVYGGRWNHKGTAMIYTSENRSLATIEYLVHLPLSISPTDLGIACIEIPNRIKPKQISISSLPKNWKKYPSPPKLASLGTSWVLSNKSLLLRVPSAIVKDDYNILINPSHADMDSVTIKQSEGFDLDERLLREQLR